jgi:predicted extracellular nuclease
MLKLLRLALPAVLLCGFGAPALAQTIPLSGGTYSQDFDTLSNTAGSTTNTALPTGWLLNETGGGARDNEQYAVDTGGSNTGDTFSYGAAGSTDRAFGGLRSGTLVATIGACFSNATGNTLTSIDVAYTGEEWRLGTAARTDALNFEYSLNATSLTTGTWTGVAALNFVTPNTTGTAGARDGNAAGNRTALSATVGSLAIANGTTFCIRWNDTDASGADDGLAIDNFSINVGGTATPALAVNDVSAIEGDSGTTSFIFAFGLSQAAGPGGVTIQYATADGTATAGSDYVAGSGTLTIPEGSNSVTFSVSVNGDTTPEANETFFVNIVSATGAVIADAQGLGTIQNDDVNVVPISQIQGSGLTSPLVGAIVTTEGIVTAQKFNNGFFLQTADASVDADSNTSEGIFVFTSTAPPATATVGNRIRVTGTVAEFTPSTNLNQLSISQIASVTSIQVLSTGNPLPAPIALTSADFNDASTPGTAEKYEGMRVSASNARTTTGADGFITESSATSSSTGVFYVVLSGVARPFREEGIDILDLFPIPSGKTPPRFDHNPERIMVRSRGQIGATALALDADTTIDSMVGVMDYFSGAWAVLPDPTGGIVVSGGKTPVAVSTPGYADVTIGAFNLLRFFDEVNDSNGAPTLTAAALDKRLTKTSLAICDFLKTPDILGVVEVENLRVLGLLADRINSTCATAPAYVPYLVQGNDQGGINVGFLVSNRSLGSVSRVEVVEVTQFGKNTVLNNPDGSTSLLNDRPPLMLRAIVHSGDGSTYPVTAFVNHLRSLNGVGDAGPASGGWANENARVSTKRAQQAVFLAELVQARQAADPNEHIVLLGDFNAFEFSDGYADVMGIVSGAAEPESQVLTFLPSPIVVPLLNGNSLIPNKANRYSYLFDGNLQTLDHVVINEAAVMSAADMEVDHARINAEFGVHHFGIAGTALRVSDHDPVRLRVTPSNFRRADLGVTASASPPSVAVGGTASFTATVSNAGPGDAEFASIALVFNALVTPTVTPAASWTCGAPVQAATTTTVTCTTANFVNGGSATFTAAVITGANLAGQTLQMAAAVASQVTDSANGNNSAAASVSVFVTGNANLSTGLLGGPNGPSGITSVGPIAPGGAATFVVPVRNAGPNSAVAPRLVLTGDTALFDTFIEIPAGWTCTESGDDASYRYECSAAASLRNRTNVYFSLVVFAPDRTGNLTTTSTVSSATPDPVISNNTVTRAFVISAP